MFQAGNTLPQFFTSAVRWSWWERRGKTHELVRSWRVMSAVREESAVEVGD